MRVAINLASRPFADLAPALKNLRIAMGVLALVAVASGAGLAFPARQGRSRPRPRTFARRTRLPRITAERQQYQAMMRQPDNARTLQQAESLNQLFDEKAFSWTLAMEDLETVLPAGVQVTTLEPTAERRPHHCPPARRRPRDRAVDLVQNLEHSRHFLLPRIVGETAESDRRTEPAR